MGIISDFLKRKEIDATAFRLASNFAGRLPPHKARDPKRLMAELKIALGHLQGEHRKLALGMFGKARLMNRFQWGLIEKGYEDELAFKIGKDLITRLSRAPGSEPVQPE